MARNRGMALRPVQRIKHVIDVEGSVDDTPIITVDIVSASDTPTLGAVASVQTGSKVYGIYLHLEASHTSGTGRPNFYMIIWKIQVGI